MSTGYVHGYSAEESARLSDQAATLTELLHADTLYPPGSLVLEAGCGVGAQTVIVADYSPRASFTSVDTSEESLAEARRRVIDAGFANVAFHHADIFDLPFPPAHFDHVFVCFVLEHLPNPVGALEALMRVLKPGGSVTVIEGDHGSAYFHPDSDRARRAIQCLIDLQQEAGGDPLIGRRLYPLLAQAGYRDVNVSPRMVYVDASRPALVDGFTRKTFTAMVEGVGEQAVSQGLMDGESWAAGIRDLYRTAEDHGTFCCTFFKAVGSGRGSYHSQPPATRGSVSSDLRLALDRWRGRAGGGTARWYGRGGSGGPSQEVVSLAWTGG
ncbi:MAG: methyltransferase domain-containing protein [Streptosporangiaceae bacterium]